MKLFPLFLLLIFFTGCEKGAFGGPNYGDKFSCKINGETWTPKGDGGGSVVFGSDSPIQARYSEFGDAILINAVRKSSDSRETVRISSIVGKSTGVYLFGNGTTPLSGFLCSNYKIDTTKINEVNLTKFDEENQKIEGTFLFTAFSSASCTDTIIVTDGRFNLNFTY